MARDNGRNRNNLHDLDVCSLLLFGNLPEVDVSFSGPGVEGVLEQVISGTLGVDRCRTVLDGVV